MLSRIGSFFITVHRTVFDPSFYGEALDHPAGRMLAFVVRLAVLGAVVCGISYTRYFCDPVKGVAPNFVLAFGDVKVIDGRLVPARPTPYVPDRIALQNLFASLSGVPELAAVLPDSSVIVDTSAGAHSARRASTFLLLEAGTVVFFPTPDQQVPVPYQRLFGATGTHIPALANVSAFLKREFFWLALFFSLPSLFGMAVNLALSIVFLGPAAFILNYTRERRVHDSLIAAGYALTPVVIGTSIVAASGTHIRGVWYFFVLLSSIALFRGIRSTIPREPPTAD